MAYHLGFDVISPPHAGSRDGIVPSLKNLAYDKRIEAESRAILEIKQGKPTEEAVQGYMRSRGLGTADADKLTAYFTELSEKTTVEQLRETLASACDNVKRQERVIMDTAGGYGKHIRILSVPYS